MFKIKQWYSWRSITVNCGITQRATSRKQSLRCTNKRSITKTCNQVRDLNCTKNNITKYTATDNDKLYSQNCHQKVRELQTVSRRAGGMVGYTLRMFIQYVDAKRVVGDETRDGWVTTASCWGENLTFGGLDHTTTSGWLRRRYGGVQWLRCGPWLSHGH